MRSNVYIAALHWGSKGFSLVELVVVITLVSILAAFAIPRFTRLQNDVRSSEVVALSVNPRFRQRNCREELFSSRMDIRTPARRVFGRR